ncbi:hypothetical protein EIP86_004890 [Pleurotus ostreatoroseus]|nr:hypothetical protein EIP86_004890 [Pleurotus ostreatoroseus]
MVRASNFCKFGPAHKVAEGYSTMCGHATIALGRFFVDTHDPSVFPGREKLVYDADSQETLLRLHVPCGVVHVRVPTTGVGKDARSDGTRAVRFTSVPSFASAVDVRVDIPEDQRWTQLTAAGRAYVTVDIAFGGAYYAIVSASELGFDDGILAHDLRELDDATATVKALLAPCRELFAHPSERDLEYLYGVIVVEERGERRELGLCFFANQQIDRSPTGSGVCARVALSVAKRVLAVGDEVEYESLVSLDVPGNAFVGKAVSRTSGGGVVVEVGGRGFYTGAHCFLFETALDGFSDGFEVRGHH